MKQPVTKRPVIVITGFMATGKTTVGRLLAAMTGLDFVDTDAEIEHRTGTSVGEIFEKHGEVHFRELERKLCADLQERNGVVIATGGGTLIDDRNHDRFRDNAHIFCLDVPVDVLCERAGDIDTRPLLAGESGSVALRERLASILARRADAYAKIGRPIDNTRRTAEETAASIAALVDFPVSRTIVNPLAALGATATTHRGRFGISQIDSGRGAISSLGRRLGDLGIDTRAFIMMPPGVQTLFRARIGASLDAVKLAHEFIDIDDGDAAKNFDQVHRLIDRLVAAGAGRDSVVIPVGGGVTGDVGGVVASVFMRGVPLVHVPTTLLAQVDSSIGGKVGINHAAAKNLIGSFYQPHLVLIDPAALLTLPLDEVANGMAEVIKSALIASESLFNYVETHTKKPRDACFRDIDFLEHCVTESAAIKCRIVGEDPFEGDRRRALNLGHTVGHALEAAGAYGDLKHGQGVSIGLVVALRIAVARNAIDPAVLERTTRLLSWCGLPVNPGAFDRAAVLGSMRLDKKVRRGELQFVLPIEIGHTRIVGDVSEDEILRAMEER
jgi:shikimate kinase/3-dehydroquinate synthase